MLKSQIKDYYKKHSLSRICQGDILRDFEIYTVDNNYAQNKESLEYVVVVTQDCDLESFSKFPISEDDKPEEFSQYLPNLFLLPAFPAEKLREGLHLEDLYAIKTKRITSDDWKKLKDNQMHRYHHFPEKVDWQIPELVIDFKIYYTAHTHYTLMQYKEKYVATFNELFRERLSQRFVDYLGRIALPNIDK
ncbi:MAG: hypothetical protein KJ995_05495 [Candidatus Omnitrophica bacterium]|nr:hypothetical protein [Candidatus Omnitrophota bacterium]